MKRLQRLSTNKTPGFDEMGSEYYKSFTSVLILKLKILYNGILEGKKIPYSWKYSLTTLIPKPNRQTQVRIDLFHY